MFVVNVVEQPTKQEPEMAGNALFEMNNFGSAVCYGETVNNPDRYEYRDTREDCSVLEVLGYHRGAFANVWIFDVPTPSDVEDAIIVQIESDVLDEDIGNEDDQNDRDWMPEALEWIEMTYGNERYGRLTALESFVEDDVCRRKRKGAILCRDGVGIYRNGEVSFHQSWKVATTGQKASHQWSRHERQYKTPWQERYSERPAELLAQEIVEFHDACEHDRVAYCEDLDLCDFGPTMRDASGIEYVDAWTDVWVENWERETDEEEQQFQLLFWYESQGAFIRNERTSWYMYLMERAAAA